MSAPGAHAPHDGRQASPEQTGEIAGLWRGGDHRDGTQATAPTDHCHDITVFPALKIAAGACSGNGTLFDIADPLNPKPIDAVADTTFACWHSATFQKRRDAGGYR